MSSINPNNINILYPIAGQDNDTQGFRNNFRSIKDNFTQAATELTALQTTAARSPQIKYQGDITTNPVAVPVSASAPGVKGQLAFDSTHFYVCTATNQWLTLSNADIGAFLTTYTGNISAGNLNVTNVTYTNQEIVNTNEIITGNATIGGNLTTSGTRIVAGYQYYAPTTNFTYTVNNNVYKFIMDPTGTITNGNVVLPSANVDATLVSISSTQTVTNFKVTPNTGTTLVPSANITLTAGTSVEYFYHAVEAKWYKVR